MEGVGFAGGGGGAGPSVVNVEFLELFEEPESEEDLPRESCWMVDKGNYRESWNQDHDA